MKRTCSVRVTRVYTLEIRKSFSNIVFKLDYKCTVSESASEERYKQIRTCNSQVYHEAGLLKEETRALTSGDSWCLWTCESLGCLWKNVGKACYTKITSSREMENIAEHL